MTLHELKSYERSMRRDYPELFDPETFDELEPPGDLGDFAEDDERFDGLTESDADRLGLVYSEPFRFLIFRRNY